MDKFVLFIARERWAEPPDVNLQKAFAEAGRNFGPEHPVLFASMDAKGPDRALAGSAAIAIAWEPLNANYRKDQKAKLRDELLPFVASAQSCMFFLHNNTRGTVWGSQRQLITNLRLDIRPVEDTYSRKAFPPYSTFCSVVAAAGASLSAFEHHLGALAPFLLKGNGSDSKPSPKDDLGRRDDLSPKDDLLARLGETGWLHDLKGANTFLQPTRKDIAPDQPPARRREQYEIIKEHPSDFIERRIIRGLTELREHPFVQASSEIEMQLVAIIDRLFEANRTWFAINAEAHRAFAHEGADWIFAQMSLLCSEFELIASTVSNFIQNLEEDQGEHNDKSPVHR